MPLPEITLTHELPAADLQFLEARIYDHNRAATGRDDGSLFGLFMRGADGGLLAGLHGWTWATVGEIRMLWVDPALRGQGIGAELLRQAEAEARARGCQRIILTTYSFQAPELYRRFGFKEAGRVEGFPPGSTYYLFEKSLA